MRKIHRRRDRIPISVFLGFPGDSDVKESYNMGDLGSDPWVRKIPGGVQVIHLSILVCRIPYTEERGRLQSMGQKESDMD